MIVVTGALGFVGGRFIEMMRESNSIIGVDRKAGESGKNVTYISMDLTDENAFDKLDNADDIESIVHCAAIISPKKCQEDPRLAYRTNILGTLNMLEYARRKDIKKFVYISSGGVYMNSDSLNIVTEDWPIIPRGIYAISKVAAENTVKDFSKNYGIDSAAFRITAPYGPGMYNITKDTEIPDALHRHALIFALKCARNEDIIMPTGGDHTVNYTYVDDIIHGIQLALKTRIGGFEAFNLAGGKNYKISELGQAVKKICTGIRVEIGPGDLLHSKVTNDPMNSLLPIKQGLFDVSKASKLLGYKPAFSSEDGMRNLISSFREQLRS